MNAKPRKHSSNFLSGGEFRYNPNSPVYNPNYCKYRNDQAFRPLAGAYFKSFSANGFNIEDGETYDHANENNRPEQVIPDRSDQLRVGKGMKRSCQAACQATMSGDGMKHAGWQWKIGRRHKKEDEKSKEQSCRHHSAHDTALK
jgi:hypothetical protein